MYGEAQGYWLPELLEHMASHGIVTVCPYLSGLPDSGGAEASISAAKMLSDLQPCEGVVEGSGGGGWWGGGATGRGATVDGGALGVAGYSLGAGRAVRGAAGVTGRDVIKAVVALHTWDGGYFTSVPAPLMIISGSEDTNAPYSQTKRIYDRATGPKIAGVLAGTNHYTSPRFWAGPMTAFLLTHLAQDAEAERYAWGRGLLARHFTGLHLFGSTHSE